MTSDRIPSPPFMDPTDVRVDTYSNIAGASVRVTHLPTGAVATSGLHGSAYRAHEEAMRLLSEKLAAAGNATTSD